MKLYQVTYMGGEIRLCTMTPHMVAIAIKLGYIVREV